MKILSVVLFSAFAAVLFLLPVSTGEAYDRGWFAPDWSCPEDQTEKHRDLFRAVQSDDREKVRILLDCGAEVNARNSYRQIPLHWAMFLDDPWMTNFLISKGADPTIKHNGGWTPAEHAEQYHRLKRINLRRKTAQSCAEGEEVNPFNLHECRPVFSCGRNGVEVADRVCQCELAKRFGFPCDVEAVCPGPEAGLSRYSQCRTNVAVQNVDASICPAGGENRACRAAVAEARLEREFEISPMSSIESRIRGDVRALELGLSGVGVTIGVAEFNPYWTDDCAIGENTASLNQLVVTSLDRGRYRPHVSRPNEEVPARYANYEDGECDRGLVRTHSDFPSIRVDGRMKPLPSSFHEHPEGRVQTFLNHVVAVFGVLAAQKNGYGIVGVAPEADYVAGPFTYDWDKSPDVEIVNYSVSPIGDLPITSYAVVDEGGATLTTETRENLLASLDPWYGKLRIDHVTTRLPADRRINVIGAGNNSYGELEGFGGMPLYFPELRGNNLAVVAVGVGFSRRIATYSNRCGLAGASFCLAAPVMGLMPNPDIVRETYRGAYGTSIAAPMVAGALALVKEYFNRMGGIGNDELVRRILQTADKSGRYADESIYGAGLLDLENALTPQGELRLFSGQSVSDSESHLLSQSGLRTGPAFGDSIDKALEDSEIAAFDKLNAPFPVVAAGLVQSERENGSLRDALLALQFGRSSPPKAQWDFANGFGWWSLRGASRAGQPEIKSVFGADNAYANPYSALAGDGMSAGLEWDSLRVAMFGETPGQDSRPRGAVGSFSFAPFSETTENGGWILHFGGVDEPNGFLSSSGSGAFGDLRSRTAFVGADYVGEKMNGWRIRLGGFAGDTSADNGEWFAGTESLRSDSFHLGVERENIFYSGDGLGFRLHQPLRASGSLKIRIPTGRTRYGDLTWREVSGKTSGRELALEGLYRRSFEGGSWRVSAGAVSEPGHRAEAKTIGRMLFAFEREF